jgi:L-alanine-DL-glutamate epimerase-like enolase superfamily enzyme
VHPRELFERGSIRVPDRPGFGIELDDRIVRAHPV